MQKDAEGCRRSQRAPSFCGDTPLHGGHRPDPEVLGVDAHVLHPYIGPPYSQIALAFSKVPAAIIGTKRERL